MLSKSTARRRAGKHNVLIIAFRRSECHSDGASRNRGREDMNERLHDMSPAGQREGIKAAGGEEVKSSY